MYSCKTELFEIELIICIKMDLVLHNLQMLICNKNQPTNQPAQLTFSQHLLTTLRLVLVYHKSNLKNMVTPIILMLGLDMNSRLIGSSLSDHFSNQVRARVIWNGISNLTLNPEKELFAFPFILMLLRKAWIHLFSFQLWVNNRAD